MRNSLRSTLQRLGAEVRGAEIAEAAAVLPLMFMMLLGIFWFGQAFSIYGAITRAAQEGARAGAAPYCTTCTGANPLATNAVNAVNTAMAASKLDLTLAQPPTTTPVFTACSGGSSSCSVSSTNVCVQAPVRLSGVTSGATGVCGVSVSFQYPFQFWLPFTSLNKQKIWLAASARVRMETQ
ncbi:MAG: TadE/TadG family type IV pilus assembly protein [Candidatus Sulfotelmatobacter sp.]